MAAPSPERTRTAFTRVKRKSFRLLPAASAPPATRCGTQFAVVSPVTTVAHPPPAEGRAHEHGPAADADGVILEGGVAELDQAADGHEVAIPEPPEALTAQHDFDDGDTVIGHPGTSPPLLTKCRTPGEESPGVPVTPGRPPARSDSSIASARLRPAWVSHLLVALVVPPLAEDFGAVELGRPALEQAVTVILPLRGDLAALVGVPAGLADRVAAVGIETPWMRADGTRQGQDQDRGQEAPHSHGDLGPAPGLVPIPSITRRW